jgi:tetratricopeptide (TPR) repeat protein
VALLEDGSEWLTLLGTDHTGRTLPGGEVTRREIADGHLKHARLRLPGDPRWELADVRARMQDVLGLQVAAATGPPARGLFFDGRFDVLRHAEQAVRGVNTGKLNDLERDLRRLVDVEAVSADAGVQLGYLRLLRREWKDALAHFDRAAARTRDKFLTTAIDYFRGWIFERTDRPADAIAAYQRAYANAPDDQNLSSLLAAQLFLVNRRQEAAEILDAIWRTVPSDLVLQFEGGDARFAGEYVRQMREALR